VPAIRLCHGSPRAVGGHAFLRDGDVCLVMLVLCGTGHRCHHESPSLCSRE
jgi:hypothetical protein